VFAQKIFILFHVSLKIKALDANNRCRISLFRIDIELTCLSPLDDAALSHKEVNEARYLMSDKESSPEKNTAGLPDEKEIESVVAKVLASFAGDKAELIPILQQVQQKLGYLPQPAMKHIARFIKVPESTVYGVATFYAQFKFVPSGRNIVRVCRGTACHVKGGARILREVEHRLGIKPGESTPDYEYALETVACIGACALAPTMTINNETHGEMTTKKVAEIFSQRSGGEQA
jgi:NADH-quinone oxidoreductase subunit E